MSEKHHTLQAGRQADGGCGGQHKCPCLYFPVLHLSRIILDGYQKRSKELS